MFARIKTWLAAIGAAIVVTVILVIAAFRKGAKQQADVDKAAGAQSLADAAEQSVKASRDRAEVENENAKLPEAPVQKVADAAPGTAAGKLRDDGWTH